MSETIKMSPPTYSMYGEERSPKPLLDAISKIRWQVTTVKKDAKVSFKSTNYTFASLPQVMEILNPLLEEHKVSLGFAFSQLGDYLFADVSVYHEPSGVEATVRVNISCSASNPKDAGSGHTYLRRYFLLSYFNLITDDDDGSVASGQRGAQISQANRSTGATRRPTRR